MRAAVFKGAGRPMEIETCPDPVPGPDEIVVKVGRCGICGTDVHMTENHDFTLPVGSNLGHEFAGEVVAKGSEVSRIKVGDRISAMPMAGCGSCISCLSGHPYVCPQWRMMMGGFGEYTLAKANLATRLPSSLSLADGALVEPLAFALRSVRMSQLSAGDKVLVLGAGAVGLATVFWARRLGAGKIVVTARSSWRASMAKVLGADAFVVSDEGLAGNVAAELGGAPDIVFEGAGASGMLGRAIDLVRPSGTVVVAGGCTQGESIVPFLTMFKEVRIQGAAAYTLRDFEHSADVLDRGAVEPRSMITETLPLEAMPAALEELRSSGGRHCKIHIDPWMT